MTSQRELALHHTFPVEAHCLFVDNYCPSFIGSACKATMTPWCATSLMGIALIKQCLDLGGCETLGSHVLHVPATCH